MSLAESSPITFILTRDRAAADVFYTGTLGLGTPRDDGFASVFDLGGATLRITEIPDHAAGPHPVLGWRVTDMAATVGGLGDAGVAMIVYPGMGQDADGVWTAPDGTKVAFFADPDGNVLSLTQPAV